MLPSVKPDLTPQPPLRRQRNPALSFGAAAGAVGDCSLAGAAPGVGRGVGGSAGAARLGALSSTCARLGGMQLNELALGA